MDYGSSFVNTDSSGECWEYVRVGSGSVVSLKTSNIRRSDPLNEPRDEDSMISDVGLSRHRISYQFPIPDSQSEASIDSY